MSFWNHYPNRKDHRREGYGAEAVSSVCRRRRSGCRYCVLGRLHKHKRRQPADQILSVAEYNAMVANEDVFAADKEDQEAIATVKLAIELGEPARPWSFDIHGAELYLLGKRRHFGGY
jgi:hypothetical protein